MKKLVFKEVSILSKIEKAARTETFDPALNLLTGENDVGKSTLIKSLYHTLGTDVPGLQNARWKKAKPIYCVRSRPRSAIEPSLRLVSPEISHHAESARRFSLE